MRGPFLKGQWVCIALLVGALAGGLPSTAHARSYVLYLLFCDWLRDNSRMGILTPREEKRMGDDAYEEYKQEQNQESVQAIGQVVIDDEYPHVIRDPGSEVLLSFQFVDTTTGLFTDGPDIMAVVYDVNLDPSDPRNFDNVGVSFDPSSNFSLPFQVVGWEPMIRATPIDPTGEPVVVTGVDGYNVAIGLGVVFYND